MLNICNEKTQKEHHITWTTNARLYYGDHEKLQIFPIKYLNETSSLLQFTHRAPDACDKKWTMHDAAQFERTWMLLILTQTYFTTINSSLCKSQLNIDSCFDRSPATTQNFFFRERESCSMVQEKFANCAKSSNATFAFFNRVILVFFNFNFNQFICWSFFFSLTRTP